MPRRLVVCLALAAALFAAPAVRAADPPKVPDGVTYEPDPRILQSRRSAPPVDLARPSKGDEPPPPSCCIHGGGFRAGNRHGYDNLCIRLASAGLRRRHRRVPPGPEISIPRGRLRLQGRDALAPARTPASITSIPTALA